MVDKDKNLIAEQHPNLELFMAHAFEISSGKLSLDFLEHPLFSLQSRGRDMDEFEYYSNDSSVKITIKPSRKGRMTIRDADFIAFLQAKLVQMKKEGKLTTETPELVIEVAEFLTFANRGHSGPSYVNVRPMLDRIAGTSIEAEYDLASGRSKIDSTTIIDSEWSIVTEKDKTQLLAFKVKLRSWFVRPIVETDNYLTISREFFKIKSDAHRRFWQIARMHANNKVFKISWEKFHNKVGTKQSLGIFRSRLRKEMKENSGMIQILNYVITESEDQRLVHVVEKATIEG